jgi:hypothetical protein
VLPHGLDVDPQFKRDNTISVRPFRDPSRSASDDIGFLGAPVGIFPSRESRRTTNPRDLTWEEFEKLQILLGTVQEMRACSEPCREDGMVPCDGMVDFGPARGIVKSRMWLRPIVLAENGNICENLQGRHVLAVTNLDGSSSDGLYEAGAAAILTVNGYTTLEPAKKADNGYKLA